LGCWRHRGLRVGGKGKADPQARTVHDRKAIRAPITGVSL
jgi:hypothetical protein